MKDIDVVFGRGRTLSSNERNNPDRGDVLSNEIINSGPLERPPFLEIIKVQLTQFASLLAANQELIAKSTVSQTELDTLLSAFKVNDLRAIIEFHLAKNKVAEHLEVESSYFEFYLKARNVPLVDRIADGSKIACKIISLLGIAAIKKCILEKENSSLVAAKKPESRFNLSRRLCNTRFHLLLSIWSKLKCKLARIAFFAKMTWNWSKDRLKVTASNANYHLSPNPIKEHRQLGGVAMPRGRAGASIGAVRVIKENLVNHYKDVDVRKDVFVCDSVFDRFDPKTDTIYRSCDPGTYSSIKGGLTGDEIASNSRLIVELEIDRKYMNIGERVSLPRLKILANRIAVPLFAKWPSDESYSLDEYGNCYTICTRNSGKSVYPYLLYDTSEASPAVEQFLRNWPQLVGTLVPPDVDLIQSPPQLSPFLEAKIGEWLSLSKTDSEIVMEVSRFIQSRWSYPRGFLAPFRIFSSPGDTVIEQISHALEANCFDSSKLTYVILTRLGIQCRINGGLSLAGTDLSQRRPVTYNPKIKLAAFYGNRLVRDRKITGGFVEYPIFLGNGHSTVEFFDRQDRRYKLVDPTPSGNRSLAEVHSLRKRSQELDGKPNSHEESHKVPKPLAGVARSSSDIEHSTRKLASALAILERIRWRSWVSTTFENLGMRAIYFPINLMIDDKYPLLVPNYLEKNTSDEKLFWFDINASTEFTERHSVALSLVANYTERYSLFEQEQYIRVANATSDLVCRLSSDQLMSLHRSVMTAKIAVVTDLVHSDVHMDRDDLHLEPILSYDQKKALTFKSRKIHRRKSGAYLSVFPQGKGRAISAIEYSVPRSELADIVTSLLFRAYVRPRALITEDRVSINLGPQELDKRFNYDLELIMDRDTMRVNSLVKALARSGGSANKLVTLSSIASLVYQTADLPTDGANCDLENESAAALEESLARGNFKLVHLWHDEYRVLKAKDYTRKECFLVIEALHEVIDERRLNSIESDIGKVLDSIDILTRLPTKKWHLHSKSDSQFRQYVFDFFRKMLEKL